MTEKDNVINWASKSNKKKLFSTTTKQAKERMKSVTGSQLLKKIGNSAEEMYKFLTATTRNQEAMQLPPIFDVSIEQLTNLILGLQVCYSERQAARVRLEHISELSMDRVRDYVFKRPNVLRMLPPRQEKNEDGLKVLRMPQREFLFTLCQLEDRHSFMEFISEARKANKKRIKDKEATEYKIVDEFQNKAMEQEVTLQDKGNMSSSIINKSKKVDAKRKRAVDKGRDPDAEYESSDEIWQPEEVPDNESEQDPRDNQAEAVNLSDLQEDLNHKTSVLKQLEIKLQRRPFDQTKAIENDDERREAQEKIAEELERDFGQFSLKIPTYEEANQNYDTD